MRKVAILLIVLMMVGVGFLSGCNEEKESEFPVVSASGTPTSGTAPLNVSFTGSGTDIDGYIISYQWNFNDGSTSTQQNPSHIFTTQGTYIVTLTVTDDKSATATDIITITVKEKPNQLPTVSPTANPVNGVQPLNVYFTGIASDPDGYISSYLWDFNDGQNSTLQNPTHTFSNSGTYSVKFTAIDNKGASVYNIVVITVYKDTDGDRIPDIEDPDDDNDGYLDSQDYLPKQDAKIWILLNEFRVIDEVDPVPENGDAEIYFEILINEVSVASIRPSTNDSWSVDIGELKTINANYIYNCDDDKNIYKINIRMWDYDGGISSEFVDIDGTSDTKTFTIFYDIITGHWYGNDSDGITDGSDDGTQQLDDNDAYLKYNIKTV